MLRPRWTSPFPTLLIPNFFGLEPLSDSEGPLIFLLLDMNIIESILKQSDFLSLTLKERCIRFLHRLMIHLLIKIIRLDEDKKSILQLLYMILQQFVLLLQLIKQNLIFKLRIRQIPSFYTLPTFDLLLHLMILNMIMMIALTLHFNLLRKIKTYRISLLP